MYTICHNLLLANLRAYGVGEKRIDFLHSYLSGRKQRVKVNGFSRIGYRCIVGPCLFNVFINDLNFSVQLSSLRLYADDTTAYASNTDISALELSLIKDRENLSSWFASNYLSVWPSPVFFRLPSNAFPDIGSVGLKKKKPKKIITRRLGIVGPGTPGRR